MLECSTQVQVHGCVDRILTVSVSCYPGTQEHYEQPRKAANLAMIAALDGVKAAFGSQAAPVAALRTLGLNLINAAGPVRNGIMQFAMAGGLK
jgi:2-polyprenyl-6-methoxyphenol hydroxylase-like FAD-dependent oxidoreductase